MKARHFYLELIEGDKVIKRKPTSLASEYRDRQVMETFKTPSQEIYFVASSTKEKVIQ